MRVSGAIVTMLLDRPMCRECLAKHAGISEDDVLREIHAIAATRRVRAIGGSACRECGQTRGRVYSLAPAYVIRAHHGWSVNVGSPYTLTD